MRSQPTLAEDLARVGSAGITMLALLLGLAQIQKENRYERRIPRTTSTRCTDFDRGNCDRVLHIRLGRPDERIETLFSGLE